MAAGKPQASDHDRRREFWRRLVIVAMAVGVTVPVVMKSRPRVMISPLAAFPVLSSPVGYVRIGGDVRHPGIYPVAANAMTDSVILLAEPVKGPLRYVPAGIGTLPLSSGADLRVTIDPVGTTRVAAGSLPTAQRLLLGIPLDINAMNEADFDRLPGIGPVMARRIVEYRQANGGLMAVEDLLSINGIGQKKYVRLRKLFN